MSERYLLVMQRLEQSQHRIDVEMGWYTLDFVAVMTFTVLSVYLLGCYLLKRKTSHWVISGIFILGLLAMIAVCIMYF